MHKERVIKSRSLNEGQGETIALSFFVLPCWQPKSDKPARKPINRYANRKTKTRIIQHVHLVYVRGSDKTRRAIQ